MARRAQFEQSVGWLAGDEAAGMTHDEFEQHLDMQGRELLRRRLPDHLDLRAHQECRLAAVEASRELFDAAQDAIARGCGQALGKRQVEALAQAAAVDFDALDAHHQHPPAQATDVLVISCDGKGIVMRPDALRPATAKAAQATSSKLASRPSKGEQRCRKRMAEVGAVYDIRPVARSPDDIMNRNDPPRTNRHCRHPKHPVGG